MGVVRTLLTIVDVVCALLLVGVILLQRSRSEGMGGMTFGAGMGEALFGSRTGNVLTRATVTLASVFLGASLLLSVLNPSSSSSRSIIDETVPDIPAAPAAGPGPLSGAPEAMPAAAAPAAPAAAPASLPTPAAPAAPAAPVTVAPVAPVVAPAPAAAQP